MTLNKKFLKKFLMILIMLAPLSIYSTWAMEEVPKEYIHDASLCSLLKQMKQTFQLPEDIVKKIVYDCGKIEYFFNILNNYSNNTDEILEKIHKLHAGCGQQLSTRIITKWLDCNQASLLDIKDDSKNPTILHRACKPKIRYDVSSNKIYGIFPCQTCIECIITIINDQGEKNPEALQNLLWAQDLNGNTAINHALLSDNNVFANLLSIEAKFFGKDELLILAEKFEDKLKITQEFSNNLKKKKKKKILKNLCSIQ